MTPTDQALRKLAEVAPELADVEHPNTYNYLNLETGEVDNWFIIVYEKHGDFSKYFPVLTCDELLAEIRRRGYDTIYIQNDDTDSSIDATYNWLGDPEVTVSARGDTLFAACALALVEVIERG